MTNTHDLLLYKIYINLPVIDKLYFSFRFHIFNTLMVFVSYVLEKHFVVELLSVTCDTDKYIKSFVWFIIIRISLTAICHIIPNIYQCVQNSIARIFANTNKYSYITPVRKALHWLPIKHHSIFKTAVLVYKFLHSGNPKYFEPFLIPRHSAYNIRRQSDGIFLEVLHFASVFKS